MDDQQLVTPRQLLRRVLPLLQAYRHLAADAYEIPSVRTAKLNEADEVIAAVEEIIEGV